MDKRNLADLIWEDWDKNTSDGKLKSIIATTNDINASGWNNRTPLIAVIRNNRPEIAAELLKRGADVESRTKDGWNCFHYAAENSPRSLDCLIRHFLKGGHSFHMVNQRDENGHTPLWRAANNDNLAACRILLSIGAQESLDIKNHESLTPGQAAHTEEVQAYLAEYKGKIKDSPWIASLNLVAACRWALLLLAKQWIESGADPDYRDARGRPVEQMVGQDSCSDNTSETDADFQNLLTQAKLIGPQKLPRTLEQRMGRSVELKLTLGAEIQTHNIVWFKNGEVLTFTERFNMFMDGCQLTLSIAKCELEDSGEYGCQIWGIDCGKTAVDIKDSLDEVSLLHMADGIGKHWRKLGVYLGFTWDQLDAFEHNEVDLSAIVHKMLIKWKQKFEDGEHEQARQILENAMKDLHMCKDLGKWSADEPSLLPEKDVFLLDLADAIGSMWKDLGLMLGFKKSELEKFAANHKMNITDAIFEMLQKWKQREGTSANSFFHLMKCLRDTGHEDLMDELEGRIKGCSYARLHETIKEQVSVLAENVVLDPLVEQFKQIITKPLHEQLASLQKVGNTTQSSQDIAVFALLQFLLNLPNSDWVPEFLKVVGETHPPTKVRIMNQTEMREKKYKKIKEFLPPSESGQPEDKVCTSCDRPMEWLCKCCTENSLMAALPKSEPVHKCAKGYPPNPKFTSGFKAEGGVRSLQSAVVRPRVNSRPSTAPVHVNANRRVPKPASAIPRHSAVRSHTISETEVKEMESKEERKATGKSRMYVSEFDRFGSGKY